MTTFRGATEVAGRLAARWRELLALGGIVALAALACSGLFEPGWFESHESSEPVARLIALSHELASGDWYPRWLSLGYLGKGVPFFEFYAPGFYLVAGWLREAGLPILASLKGGVLLFVVLGGWGMWRWCAPHLGSWGALLASASYMFAPYHFVDLYVRGALAEVAALGVLPWLFRGVDSILERGASAGALALTATAAAGVVLVHNLSVLLIAPFVLLYAIVRVRTERRGVRALATIALGGAVVGPLLSAFFWLPAVADRDAIRPVMESMTSGFFAYRNHFVSPVQWGSLAWGFGGSVPGAGDGMSFQIGPLLLGGTVGALALSGALERSTRRFVLLCAALGGLAILLTSEAGAWWYRLAPPYRLVQFPWRFLGPATLLLAPCAGAVATAATRLDRRFGPPALVGAAVAALIALSTAQRGTRERFTLGEDGDHHLMQSVASDPPFGGLAYLDEYLPRWASAENAPTLRGGPFPRSAGAVLHVRRAETRRLVLDAQVAGAEATLTVPWHWFPGWRVEIDGRRGEIGPDAAGLLTFTLPPGNHRADVRFGTTPARILGWLLAVAGVAVLAAAAARQRVARRIKAQAQPEAPR